MDFPWRSRRRQYNERADTLWSYVYNGSLHGVQEALSAPNVNVEERDDYSRPCLHIASRNGRLDIMLALLDAGADVNSTDRRGFTALHRAVQKGEQDCFDELLTRGCRLDIVSREGDAAPIHWALRDGRLAMAWAMLDRDPGLLSLRNSRGRNLLGYICSRDSHVSLEAIRGLLARDLERQEQQGPAWISLVNAVDNNGCSALWLACSAAAMSNRTEVLRALVDHGARVDLPSASAGMPLARAVETMATVSDALMYLLDVAEEQGVLQQAVLQRDNNQRTLLMVAASSRIAVSDVVFRRMLDADPSPQLDAHNCAGGITLLMTLCEMDHSALVDVLLDDPRCDINEVDSHGQSALTYAVRSYRTACAVQLVQRGADATVVSKNGSTWLHAMCSNERRSLERQGRLGPTEEGNVAALHVAAPPPHYVNIVNHEGKTALQLAVLAEDAASVKVLLEYGASVEHRDDRGFSIAHIAADLSDINVLRAIMEHGINPNVRVESTGDTPLHVLLNSNGRMDWRSPYEVVDCAIALITGGADPHVENRAGWRPAERLLYLGDARLTSVIKKHRTDPMLCFLVGCFKDRGSTPASKSFASHKLFDDALLGIIFEYVDGKEHKRRIKYSGSLTRRISHEASSFFAAPPAANPQSSGPESSPFVFDVNVPPDLFGAAASSPAGSNSAAAVASATTGGPEPPPFVFDLNVSSDSFGAAALGATGVKQERKAENQ